MDGENGTFENDHDVSGGQFIPFREKNAVFKFTRLVWTEGLSGEKVAFSSLSGLVLT